MRLVHRVFNPSDLTIYGKAARPLALLLEDAAQIEICRQPTVIERSQGIDLISTRHLPWLARTSTSVIPRDVSIRVCTGGLDILPALFEKARRDASSWAPDGPWAEAVASASRTLSGSIDLQMRRRLGGPLWPLEATVDSARPIQVPLIGLTPASQDNIPTSYRPAVLALLVQIDYHIHDCLAWELLSETEAADNPLHSLIKAYAKGVFPIGFDDDALLVFAYSGSESVDSAESISARGGQR